MPKRDCPWILDLPKRRQPSRPAPPTKRQKTEVNDLDTAKFRIAELEQQFEPILNHVKSNVLALPKSVKDALFSFSPPAADDFQAQIESKASNELRKRLFQTPRTQDPYDLIRLQERLLPDIERLVGLPNGVAAAWSCVTVLSRNLWVDLDNLGSYSDPDEDIFVTFDEHMVFIARIAHEELGPDRDFDQTLERLEEDTKDLEAFGIDKFVPLTIDFLHEIKSERAEKENKLAAALAATSSEAAATG